MLPFESQKCRLTSRYANRVHPITGAYEFHHGVDLVGIDTQSGDGEKIVAVHDGTVVRSRMVPRATDTGKTWTWGNYIAIQGTDGITIYYCHLNERLAQVGATVRAGDVIGIEGATGQATGVHLHFECRRGNAYVNAAEYLGIANAVGTYDGALLAIKDLARKNVINGPDYWEAHYEDIPYLSLLIVRSADKITKAGTPCADLETALAQLVKAGVCNTPDYWRNNADEVEHLPEFIRKVGGSVCR